MKTPLMQQYSKARAEHPGELLLFQMGDFFETFYDDAVTLSKALGIALTSREMDRESGSPVPLAGFPVHALDGYLSRLIRAGFRVAVCEQTEDPKKAKKLVRREVTEVVTPGTLIGGQALGERETVLLASVFEASGRSALAFCDLADGVIEAVELVPARTLDELARRSPRELLAPEGFDLGGFDACPVTRLEGWRFDSGTAEAVARRRLGLATLDGLGMEGSPSVTGAVGALLGYVEDVKRNLVSSLRFQGIYRLEDRLVIDGRSALALDLVDTAGPDRSAVLADATDMTVTPQGARRWREWLLSPPSALPEISARHDAVAALAGHTALQSIRGMLSECADLSRLTGRLATRKASPRDLRALAETARLVPALSSALRDIPAAMLSGIASADALADIADIVESTIRQSPPQKPGEGDTIADGISTELDELRSIRAGGREWISGMERTERDRTGIQKLSIGYNRVFGYYIEIPRSQSGRVPAEYSRRQTLAGAERFVTPDLREMEARVLRAGEEIARLENEIFDSLRDRIAGEAGRIRSTGEALSVLDTLCSLAALASERGYCRPVIVDGPALVIEEGRHPVLDRLLPSGECVPNPVTLDSDRRMLIVTGPNMAGKSTYLRMAAQLLVMAQAGSFVPAASMRFSPADMIFTRIGSADRIARGQSTFLVEMADAAKVLNSSTPRSLAVIDEVGRGTSTYDGLSLAWAMVEHLHSSPVHRPLTIFATHYHELTALGSRLPGAANVNVAVRESSGRIVFLYRVEEGATDRSYGLHVASMAGVPGPVVARAGEVLADLESGRHSAPEPPQPQLELPLDQPQEPVLEAIKALDPDSLSPRTALELIYQLKRMLE